MSLRLILIPMTLVGLSIVGCTSPSKAMQSWVGSHYSKMQEKWGAPHRITPDGKGGKILTYEYISATEGNLYTSVREFYIDDDGIIYRWRWQNR